MLVVVHQNHGVRGLADAGVVIRPIGGRQANHQFQVGVMQVCRKFGDELAEILLAFLGNFFKINDESGEVVLREVLHRLLRQVLARRVVFQHGGHFVGEPIGAIGIVQQRHGGNFDGRFLQLQRLQPCRQFGIGFDVQAATGRDRVEALGNEHVNIAEMLLERRERRRVPAHIKGGAQRIIGGRHLAQGRHAAVPAGSF